MKKKGILASAYYSYGPYRFRINASKTRPIMSFAMKRLVEQIEALMSHYARGNFLLFNLHNGPVESSSAVVSTFLRELKRYLGKTYGEQRVMHTWGRERNTAQTPHYHVLIGVDGSKVSNWKKLKGVISELWNKAFAGGSVYFPKNGYYLTHREDCEVVSELIKRASYIVKVATKESNPTHSRNYSCSQIEKNPHKKGFDFGI
ncbi:YagK/YfjJ domain-containing protein [Vibrio alfacsensis]|uniref:YagK/YfjJ domain-containing protein n=1 Tax=Vibrio alfacsensis TaxID=1074311 RepID=UPI0040684233